MQRFVNHRSLVNVHQKTSYESAKEKPKAPPAYCSLPDKTAIIEEYKELLSRMAMLESRLRECGIDPYDL